VPCRRITKQLPAHYWENYEKRSAIKPSLSQQKERPILLGVIFGLFGLVTGLSAALSANSTAILSEVLKNAGLIIAVFLSWLSLRKVHIRKTEGYNYGYGKLENFSGLLVAIVMIVSFFLILYHTVERFQARVEMYPTGVDVCSQRKWDNQAFEESGHFKGHAPTPWRSYYNPFLLLMSYF